MINTPHEYDRLGVSLTTEIRERINGKIAEAKKTQVEQAEANGRTSIHDGRKLSFTLKPRYGGMDLGVQIQNTDPETSELLPPTSAIVVGHINNSGSGKLFQAAIEQRIAEQAESLAAFQRDLTVQETIRAIAEEVGVYLDWMAGAGPTMVGTTFLQPETIRHISAAVQRRLLDGIPT